MRFSPLLLVKQSYRETQARVMALGVMSQSIRVVLVERKHISNKKRVPFGHPKNLNKYQNIANRNLWQNHGARFV
ncbi:hypothetical protein A3752_11045 [Oleiphilus sp. HI0081]|nr:hypothetical protein A3732_17190 [Oleiphilus sp. HI0050]KZZ20682.1 hypothetical protein A3752_11045 [Oleiphilus sp. HI0081]KZZ68895.1 hypothetical protein A3763_13450 [Oleiphilus sp. HI0128]